MFIFLLAVRNRKKTTEQWRVQGQLQVPRKLSGGKGGELVLLSCTTPTSSWGWCCFGSPQVSSPIRFAPRLECHVAYIIFCRGAPICLRSKLKENNLLRRKKTSPTRRPFRSGFCKRNFLRRKGSTKPTPRSKRLLRSGLAKNNSRAARIQPNSLPPR